MRSGTVLRTFIALELDPAVRRGIHEEALEIGRQERGLRVTAEDRLHLTLRFLGDLADDRIPGVVEAVRATARGIGPFTMQVGGLGCFPARGPVRIVWAGVEEASGSLNRVAESVEKACRELGFPAEKRAFRPHVTVGRVRDPGTGRRLRGIVERARGEVRAQPVREVRVKMSELRPRGPRYEDLGHARLLGDASPHGGT